VDAAARGHAVSASRARLVARFAGGISLLLFPLLFMLVFALHMETPAEILRFRLQHEPYLAADIMTTLADAPRAQRYYVLPHVLGYLAMPVLIAAAVTLGRVLFRARPWLALTGAAMTCIGAVFMGGMLAIWAAFAPLGEVPGAGATAALEALMRMRGALLISTVLAGLSMLGLVVLAVGLYLSRIVPRWSPVLIIAGSVALSVFIDVDNLMFAGAFLVLLGMAPVAHAVLRGEAAAP
jgi:hypothetical protein